MEINDDGATVDRLVIRDLAIADAEYVLRWLLQIDQLRRDDGYGMKIPDNIVDLCRSALSRFDVALQMDVDNSEPVPLSESEIDDIVRKVCR